MPALLCDVCGGNLLVDTGGKTATCQFCGTQHSMERVREKIQEIKGKVTIEGSVSVDGVAGVDSLLERAWEFYKNRDYEKASEYYNRVLDINPNHGTAREMLNLISGQTAKAEKQYVDAKKVELFGVYDAEVTDIDRFGCTVSLLASNQSAYIHASEISDPPPDRIADTISKGELLQVTVIDKIKDSSTGQVKLNASLLPPEEHVGYYLNLDTLDMMKKALEGRKCSYRMVSKALNIITQLETRPAPSLSKSMIEDQLNRCELLLAQAIHNDSNCISFLLRHFVAYCRSFDLQFQELAARRLSIDGWRTKEMQSEMQQIILAGQENASILINSSFFRRVVGYLDKNKRYVYGEHETSGRRYFQHTYYGDEETPDRRYTLYEDGNDFVYGYVIHNGKYGWESVYSFAFPDLETLKKWYANYSNKKCFAGGDLSFWSKKSSICGCTPEQCRCDNPQCPLNYNP